MLKVLIVAAAGMLTLMAIRQLMAGFRAVQARVRARPAEPRAIIRRLRQDPTTGIYYPED